MLGAVFRFEVAHRLRQPSTWIYAAVLLGLPFLMMHAINGSSQYLNAPESVMNISGVLGGVGMLVSAGMFGDAAARDVQTRMHALFYTSPLREKDYLLGRFFGVIAINAVLLLGIPAGLLLASVMPYMAAGTFGPVQPAAYVQSYVLMLFPNLILIGSCMFAAAALTRHGMATYAGGIGLFVLGNIAGRLGGRLSDGALSVLLDPFGGAAISSVTRFWTPAERNERLIGWPELMLWNRALWLVVAAGVLALLVARFRYGHPTVARRRWWSRRAVVDTAPDRIAPTVTPTASGAERSFSFASRARQVLAVAVRAWREIAATRATLVVIAGALFFVFAYGWDVGSEIFGTSTWPVTHLIAATVLSTALGPVMAVLIAIFAGELVWRERDVGIADIAGASPVPDGVALLGRFLALVAMLVVLQLVLAGAGIALQALRGWHRYEPLVYLELLFGVKLVDYVLLAALAMAIHVIVNQKYVGHLVVVLYFASTLMPGLVGLRHPMLIYGSDPGWTWSDLNGLAPFVEGIVWFKLYWAAWALLLAVLASLFWVRGRERGMSRRLVLARQRLREPMLRAAAAVAILLIVSSGGYVFYNTNVVNEYVTPDDVARRAAEYERRYKRHENAPQPSLTGAQLQVELYPEQRTAEIRGTYSFVNRSARPIDSLHVHLNSVVETRAVDFDRSGRIAVDDATSSYRLYVLDRPVAPGDSIRMTFEVAFRPRGFRDAGAPTAVTPNGASFDRSWLPLLGYQPGREVVDEVTRREQGLPPRVQLASAGDVEARAAGGQIIELVDVETTIGTDPQQIAVTSGTLVREWHDRGRRYFHYRTEDPIRFGGAIFSAEYAVREARWDRIPLRVYYHPTHDVNVDRMVRSMQASLDYFSKQFGPYQFRDLSVVEFPRYAAFARAHPATIAFSEGSAFLTRIDSGEVDRTFFVIAHETAHQWWGGQVIPVRVPGAGMVSETLAQYSAMMVLETAYGTEMARRFYDYNLDEYLRGRTVFANREAPLLDVQRQNYVYYFKGGVAMYMLRERVGADAINGALRRFLARYAGPTAPPATSRALYAELQGATPDSLHGLLSDLFEHITLWNVRTDSVRTEPDGAGAWRVTLHIDASKARADSVGRETPIAMDDLVEVGVFADDGKGEPGLGDPLHVAQHRIRSGKQAITVIVPRRPARAGVDPYRRLIERERGDNVGEVGGVDKGEERGSDLSHNSPW